MHRIAALLVACTAVACGPSTEQRAIERRAWVATAHAVVDGVRRGALPRRYAADTLRVAADALRDPALDAAADAVERGDADVALPPP